MMGAGIMGFGFLLMLLLFIAAVLLVIWLVRALSQGPDSKPTSSGSRAKEDDVEIARNRYARGEISKEEFEQIKTDLQ